MWRDMTPAEIVTLPEARLGGALMAMFVFAILAVVAVILVAIIFTFIATTRGGDVLGGGRGLPGMLFIAPSAFVVVLATIFIVMTLARASTTPMVLSVGMVVWLVLRLLFAIGGQVALANQLARSGSGTILLSTLWPVLIGLAADGIAVAALCGYMADGTRPNAFYRRRVRASGSSLTTGAPRL
ncbi:MAG TPA: hypothetical protein VJ890_03900 [Vineibacter sp.]|nr:hypothetical protein [Vineibacter sp.]